jgi:hypothetical protein
MMFDGGTFVTRIEVFVMLYNSIVGEQAARKRIKAGGLSSKDIMRYSDVIIECMDIIDETFDFPGIPNA